MSVRHSYARMLCSDKVNIYDNDCFVPLPVLVTCPPPPMLVMSPPICMTDIPPFTCIPHMNHVPPIPPAPPVPIPPVPPAPPAPCNCRKK
jgi:hypothetical protein